MLAAFWASNLPWPMAVRGDNDFVAFYAGARLAGTGGLYSAAAGEAVQREVMGEAAGMLRFIRLPLYAWVLKPLGGLPYAAAHAVWQVVLALAALGFAWVWRRRLPAVWLYLACSVAWYSAFANGQDCAIVLFFAGMSAFALLEGRDRAAGLWLTGCLIKFHLFTLAPVALLAARRWQAAAWASAGVAGVLALSTALEGPGVWVEYWQALMDPRVHPAPYTLPTVGGFARAVGLGAAWTPALSLVVGAGFVYGIWRRREQIEVAMALALAGGVVLGSHVFVQDLLLLLAPLALVAQHAALYRPLALLNSPLGGYLLLMPGPVGAVVPVALAALPWLAAGRAGEEVSVWPEKTAAAPVAD